MKYCTQCYSQCADDAYVCPNCGKAFNGAGNTVYDAAVSQGTFQQADYVNSSPQGYQYSQQVSSNQQVPFNVPQPGGAAPTPQIGYWARAKADFNNQPEAKKTGFIGGLIALVPILSFCTNGRSIAWGRAVIENSDSAEAKIINGENFKFGFFYLVLSLIFSLVFGIVCGIVSIIPVIGALVSFALTLLMVSLLQVASIRMSCARRFGAGFELGAIFNDFKRGWKGLLKASTLPWLIFGVIAGLVLTIVIIIGILIGGSSINRYMSILSGSNTTLQITALLEIIISMIGIISIPSLIVSYIGYAYILPITFRAVGYWQKEMNETNPLNGAINPGYQPNVLSFNMGGQQAPYQQGYGQQTGTPQYQPQYQPQYPQQSNGGYVQNSEYVYSNNGQYPQQ